MPILAGFPKTIKDKTLIICYYIMRRTRLHKAEVN